MSKPNVYAMMCVLLAVEAIELTDDGVFLNKEQLDKIEAEIKKLTAEKTTAVNDLTAANTAKDAAVTALTTATTAMDELDVTVKAAADPKAKVEAIRVKLASKPGAAPVGTLVPGDQTKKPIAGADPVTAYAQGIV
jgi:phage/plasmid-associated DNA primase